jgi:hypothetical protein
MTYISQALDRIRPPKREQVQFLFPSLGSVDPTRGEEGADSSNTICILKLLILRAAHNSQDWEIRSEPVPFSEGESCLLRLCFGCARVSSKFPGLLEAAESFHVVNTFLRWLADNQIAIRRR